MQMPDIIFTPEPEWEWEHDPPKRDRRKRLWSRHNGWRKFRAWRNGWWFAILRASKKAGGTWEYCDADAAIRFTHTIRAFEKLDQIELFCVWRGEVVYRQNLSCQFNSDDGNFAWMIPGVFLPILHDALVAIWQTQTADPS